MSEPAPPDPLMDVLDRIMTVDRYVKVLVKLRRGSDFRDIYLILGFLAGDPYEPPPRW